MKLLGYTYKILEKTFNGKISSPSNVQCVQDDVSYVGNMISNQYPTTPSCLVQQTHIL